MKAAVVHDFAQAPQYAEFRDPQPGPGEVLVSVTAASLSQLSKAQASGKHYRSDGVVPFVSGADGVGRLSDGRRVYFAFPTYPFGSMGEHSIVRRSLCVPLPGDLDDARQRRHRRLGTARCPDREISRCLTRYRDRTGRRQG
jgi:NADPH:quinone reductase-like Zn-dependent oxidoreductase